MYRTWKTVCFEKFDLGDIYMVGYGNRHEDFIKVRLIKVTAKGYNFLNEATNRCILKRHMYISKTGMVSLPRAFRTGIYVEVDSEKRFINII